LGVNIVQDQRTGEVWIGQPTYAESILQRFVMENVKAVNTPVDPSTKLMKTTKIVKMLTKDSISQQLGAYCNYQPEQDQT